MEDVEDVDDEGDSLDEVVSADAGAPESSGPEPGRTRRKTTAMATSATTPATSWRRRYFGSFVRDVEEELTAGA